MNKKINKILMGSDPETFIRRKDTGEYFPAIGLVTGTKAKPTPMKGLPKGFTWQIDGLLLEFNTPPASTKEEWINHHTTALRFINHNVDNEQFQICIDAVGEFNDEYFKMPGARELGCNVDFNAWTQSTNPRPDANGNQRTAAGHIHLGAEELKDQALVEECVKVLDLFLGVPSVLLDEERERRKLYGKAGCFRFAHSFVGFEYRTLSNFWLKSEELMGWVYENTQAAIDFINAGNKIAEDDEAMIQTAINNYINPFAEQLIEKYKINLPQLQKKHEISSKQS
jgi:hypothetical protein